MKIFCKFPTINISKLLFLFLLVICIAKNFIWTNLKANFSIFCFFCRFSYSSISAKYCPIITIYYYLFSFQMMHKSQFRKNDPYDWFCGPGSHIYTVHYIYIYSIVTMSSPLKDYNRCSSLACPAPTMNHPVPTKPYVSFSLKS